MEFVIRVLALGDNTLPEKGIGAISEQLASKLPTSSILLNSQVKEIKKLPGNDYWELTLENGTIVSKSCVIATEGPEARKLLFSVTGDDSVFKTDKKPRSTVCLYFSADKEDIQDEPVLFLNGENQGIVNNMCFPSSVSPSYAPPGKALVSVSLIGEFTDESDLELEGKVREQIRAWFGGKVDKWQHIRTYRIPFAQPDQTPPTNLKKKANVAPGIYVCGDHMDSATFDGALVSGARAAQELLKFL